MTDDEVVRLSKAARRSRGALAVLHDALIEDPRIGLTYVQAIEDAERFALEEGAPNVVLFHPGAEIDIRREEAEAVSRAAYNMVRKMDRSVREIPWQDLSWRLPVVSSPAFNSVRHDPFEINRRAGYENVDFERPDSLQIKWRWRDALVTYVSRNP